MTINNKPSIEYKYRNVINNNTFYFFDQEFEEKYEGHINTLKEILLVVKNRIDNEGLNKSIFYDLLRDKKENGLKALLALTGFSNESLKRLITVTRVVDNYDLNELTLRTNWDRNQGTSDIQEWSDSTIMKMVESNEYFRMGLVNLFYDGATLPFLANTLPLFELKKLGISKLSFELNAMIDSLVRYKEKGSYSGKKENNPESLIQQVLKNMEVTYIRGKDLRELVNEAPDSKRTMDFIIPDMNSPVIIIECSYQTTTSSGQGDKSKTEIAVDKLIKQHYPKAMFIGFIDGIGWYVRKSDLRRMVSAYEDVFTFHKNEMERFEKLVAMQMGFET